MKPTIYLGLGGTGNLAISYAKKLYEEEYGKGKIPASVAFVSVDFQTDMDKDPGLSTDISDNFIRIQTDTNPREFYQVGHNQRGEFTWMFEGNVANIGERISDGASQVRTTGRLYTEMVLDNIMNRLASVVNQVRFVNVDAIGDVNIHMVMSLAGGSGAGSFISLAAAIHKKYGNQVKLYGYGVTHSIFRAIDPTGVRTPNVEINTISSIMDLDYLMTASESNPIDLSIGTQKIKLDVPMFEGFFIVDNKSEHGRILKEKHQLSEVLGTCLYACGAEAGDKVRAVFNNIHWRDKKFDVGQKRGWVQGLGACQVVYKGKLMAETYALKAAVELIRKMRQEGANIQQEAINWTETVGIREDGEEFNLLIDKIYPVAKIKRLALPDLLDVTNTDSANVQEINKYIATLVEFPTEEIIKNLTDDLKNKLHEKINMYLVSENGVGNSLKFLSSLKTLCEKYRMEMDNEARQKQEELNRSQNNFAEKVMLEYNDRKHRWGFSLDRKNQLVLEDVVGRPALAIKMLLHEIKRREAARGIFVALIEEIGKLLQQLNDLKQKLDNLVDKYDDELSKLQSVSADALVFEYDLSYNERVNMSIESDDIVVADFVSSLGKPLTEVEIATELNDKIRNYAGNLPKAQEYRNKIITEVIDKLSDKDYQKLKEEIEKKSVRWLNINGRGQRTNVSQKAVEDAIAKNWLVSVYKTHDGYKCRLEKDANFLPNVFGKEFMPVEAEAARQKMLFCRIDGSLIPYCIGLLDEMSMDRYWQSIRSAQGGDSVFNPHFDKHVFEAMRAEDFKLKPEMKNESIFYWVCGHFFGFPVTEDERIMKKDEKEVKVAISEEATEAAVHNKYVRCFRKKYQYWNNDAQEDKSGAKWQSLGNTSRRETAYITFKTTVLPEQKEFFKKLIKETYSKNVEYWENEITRVANAGIYDYIDLLVCADKSSVTFFSRESEETKLIKDEFEYIQNDLLNALANLK